MVLDDKPGQPAVEPAVVAQEADGLVDRPRGVVLLIESRVAGLPEMSDAMDEEVQVQVEDTRHDRTIPSRPVDSSGKAKP